MENKNVFNDLFALNVNGHVEKKQTGGTTLSYLSWPWAVAEIKKRYPDMSYRIKTGPDGLPYVFDERTGYMVFTEVTIEGITHEMWLPVMDGANHAMKDKPYTISTKYKEVSVAPATMFDINKTIMRCLVKNLAMFGLGLYIYSGEDLPESEDSENDNKKPAAKSTPTPAADSPELTEAIKTVNDYISKGVIDKSWMTKVDLYLKNKDLDGLNKVINYYKEQAGAEAAFSA